MAQTFDYIYLNGEMTCILLVATFILFYASRQKRELIKWLPVYLLSTTDAIFRTLSPFIEGLFSFTNILAASTILSMFIIISKEYYNTFIIYVNFKSNQKNIESYQF